MLPAVLGLLGAGGTGLAAAPALRALNWPFFGLTIVMLSRAWYLETRGHFSTPLRQRARMVLVASTVVAVGLWAARFAGILGRSPI